MTDPVLDTIDHVLHDWDTSPDAMRWTPEPVLVPPWVDPEAVRRVFARVGEVTTTFMAAYREAFTRFAQKIAEMSPRLLELQCQIEAAQAAERQHNLHVAYRRRTRRRNRR